MYWNAVGCLKSYHSCDDVDLIFSTLKEQERIEGHSYVPLAFISMSVYGKFHISYFYVAVKKCEKPTSPVNGNVLIPCSTIFDGKCSFMCRPGFFLNGSKIFSCSANSKWEPTPGRCDGKENVSECCVFKFAFLVPCSPLLFQKSKKGPFHRSVLCFSLIKEASS